MPARLSAFVIWALVAASIAFWGLRLTIRPYGAPAHAVTAVDTGSMRADLTRLFGAPPIATAKTTESATPAINSRFQLTGVMAPKVAGEYGVALIAVDGKSPRAYRVGANIDTDLVLQAVTLRSAEIGPPQGKPAVVLQMPPLPSPATGTLPSAAPMAAPAVAAPPANRAFAGRRGGRASVNVHPSPEAPVPPDEAPGTLPTE